MEQLNREINADGKLKKFGTSTILADDATPDISDSNIFVTSANTAPTAITDLVNASSRVGSVIILAGGSSTNASTIADSGNFTLSASITLNADTVLGLWIRADNDYVETYRSVN